MKYIKIFEEFNNIETATAGAGGRGPGGSGPSRSGGGQAAVAMASAAGGSPPPPNNNNKNNKKDVVVGGIEGIIKNLNTRGNSGFSGTTQENKEMLDKLKIVKQKSTGETNHPSSSMKDYEQYVAISNLPELKNLLIVCTIGNLKPYLEGDADYDKERVHLMVDQDGGYKNYILDKDIFFIRLDGQFRICRSESDFNNLKNEYGATCIKIQ
jgi:hypothetical protein